MKNNETDEDKKVDDVSIKKGILSETNDTKKTKNDFKLLKFFIIILIVFVLSICINFIRNHLIIQKLAKNIDDLDQNYRLNIVDLSDEEIFNYNTYYKDGNFIEHINYILLSNSNNDFEIKQVINKGYIKDNCFILKNFY